MRTFLAVADLWGLSEIERRLILGYPASSTLRRWSKAAREHRELTFNVDTLTRISAVLGIHQSLTVLFDTKREGIEWLRLPNEATIFGGLPPFEFAVGGTLDGLMLVRRFLDATCGGVFMHPRTSLDRGFVPYNAGDLAIF